MCFKELWKTINLHPEILFVTTVEGLQQFAHMGFHTQTFLFLKHELKFSLYSAVALFHLFLAFSHVISPLWSMLADEKMNRKRAMLLATLLGLVGHVMVTLAAGAPKFTGQYMYDPPPEGWASLKPHLVWLMVVGMALVAVGHGGPREVSRALGADQFVLPAEERHLRNYYKIFFYFMAFGACTGVLIAPVLRMQVECLGQIFCFPLSFGVLALVKFLAAVVLICGWSRLHTERAEGNPLLETLVCVKTAWSAPSDVPGSGLDKASDVFTEEFVAEVRQTLRTLVLFIPLPLFWALMETQFSTWIYQGSRMEFPLLNKWHVEPDQMPIVSMLTVFVAMPMFEHFIVCCRLHRRPLLRMFFGALLALTAAGWATYVQLRIEPTLAYIPGKGKAHLLVWTPMDSCESELTVLYNDSKNNYFSQTIRVQPMGLYDFRELPVVGFQKIRLQLKLFGLAEKSPESRCPIKRNAFLRTEDLLIERTSSSIYMYPHVQDTGKLKEASFQYPFRDDLPFQDLDKCDLQLPKLYITYMAIRFGNTYQKPNDFVTLTESRNPNKNMTIYIPRQFHGVGPLHMHPTTYDYSNAWGGTYKIKLERGGVYGILSNAGNMIQLIKLVNASSAHGSWQIKQLVFLGAAKFFLPITALEYSYQQVTPRMKPVLLSFWYISVALGNFLVAGLAIAKMFDRDFWYYVTYTVLSAANLLIVLICACNVNRMLNK